VLQASSCAGRKEKFDSREIEPRNEKRKKRVKRKIPKGGSTPCLGGEKERKKKSPPTIFQRCERQRERRRKKKDRIQDSTSSHQETEGKKEKETLISVARDQKNPDPLEEGK